jgi:hypothetical protein
VGVPVVNIKYSLGLGQTKMAAKIFLKFATHVARSYPAARADAQSYHGPLCSSGLGITICVRRLGFNSQRSNQFFLFIFPVMISIKQANKKNISSRSQTLTSGVTKLKPDN